LLATSAIVFAACQGATSSPSASTAPASAAPSPSEAAAASPTVAPSPTPVDINQLLYGYSYDPTTGVPGGKVIISDWQAANQLNPYYSNAFANTEVLASTMRTLLTVTADGHYKADLSDGQITFADNVKTDADG
jgi:hypothetical protein